ncbi:hypothetical protein [Campylobacter sp. FOBRC14]|uniref:hypothetical protein n=1 Tax=Campylobacter sp. FOBRC14 TaxID=936554 RepID=UPI0005577FA7|nr:hypothetical protein [Campylobacter sp. FOBRC14]
MDRKLFNNYLNLCNINKVELANLLNLPYSTVNGWGSRNPFPAWLESWFENYIKAQKFDQLKILFSDFD